jgi:hypothetical protein
MLAMSALVIDGCYSWQFESELKKGAGLVPGYTEATQEFKDELSRALAEHRLAN